MLLYVLCFLFEFRNSLTFSVFNFKVTTYLIDGQNKIKVRNVISAGISMRRSSRSPGGSSSTVSGQDIHPDDPVRGDIVSNYYVYYYFQLSRYLSMLAGIY